MEIAALENPARVAREMAQTRLDGVYSRMEDDDCTRPCRNQMVIRIANDSVFYSWIRSVEIELPIRFDDGCSDCFELDWTRVNPSWGKAIFREHVVNGVRGLQEKGQHFWQSFHYHSPRFGHPWDRTFPTDFPMPLDNIDRVFYINLGRRTDRRPQVLGELRLLGIPKDSIVRIEAVDAEKCEEKPTVCCARSHIAALDRAMAEDLNGVLILEDDFKLRRSPEETRERWAHFCRMTPHFEIASWAHNCLQLWDWRDKGDGRVWYLQTTSAYAVRKAAMQRLRDKYSEAIAQERPFDTHMTTMRKDVQWFALRPALSYQRPGYSDIQKRNTNYGC